MPLPRFEVPTGAIDGVNKDFYVSQPYRPGSVAVFLNGQLQTKALDDGWTETDPTTGLVTLNEAPRDIGTCPDVVQIFYLDTSPALPETEIIRICGKITTVEDPMVVPLLEVSTITGTVEDDEKLTGTVVDASLLGTVQDVEKLTGTIQGVCACP